jgi:HlyD family secretion protein
MAVHTVGGVAGPGETMMTIVPENDLLVVEAQISPSEVDRVHADQEAVLRFTSLGQRTTPEYLGTVETVSPDVVVDQLSGACFYVARIKIPAEALKDLGGRLVPGMPLEVFISTGERTVRSYLIKLLRDQIMHTFREN